MYTLNVNKLGFFVIKKKMISVILKHQSYEYVDMKYDSFKSYYVGDGNI